LGGDQQDKGGQKEEEYDQRTSYACMKIQWWNPLKMKRGGLGVAQVIQHLPSKCDPWVQTPALPKKKEEGIKRVLKEVSKVHCMCVCTHHSETT
jgi:hypothetical protein